MSANPLDLAKSLGLSMVCRTCSKWSQAVERGLDRCLAVDGCGSPIVGDTFHEYDGPITDFLRFCFVCGDKATKGICVKGHLRRIGACSAHVEYVVGMMPENRPPSFPVLRTVLSDSGEAPVEILIPKREKTLGNLLQDIAFESAKKENK